MEDGEIITDARFLIGGRVYHIECQSTDDTTMALRMIEYDFAIALENGQKSGRRYRIEFPRSCVLFLRCGRNTPDFLEVEVVFPGGDVSLYQAPVIKLERYTKEQIFEKNLLMLLPFYIMRYEKSADNIAEEPQKLQGLLYEYEDIRASLEKEFSTTGKSELYMNLNKLIIRIADYIFRDKEQVRKGVDEIMGGKVLELESERLWAEGRKEGEERLSHLISRLLLDGRNADVQKAVTDAERRKELYQEYKL